MHVVLPVGEAPEHAGLVRCARASIHARVCGVAQALHPLGDREVHDSPQPGSMNSAQ